MQHIGGPRNDEARSKSLVALAQAAHSPFLSPAEPGSSFPTCPRALCQRRLTARFNTPKCMWVPSFSPSRMSRGRDKADCSPKKNSLTRSLKITSDLKSSRFPFCCKGTSQFLSPEQKNSGRDQLRASCTGQPLGQHGAGAWLQLPS